MKPTSILDGAIRRGADMTSSYGGLAQQGAIKIFENLKTERKGCPSQTNWASVSRYIQAPWWGLSSDKSTPVWESVLLPLLTHSSVIILSRLHLNLSLCCVSKRYYR
jgi:hypothetical protein